MKKKRTYYILSVLFLTMLLAASVAVTYAADGTAVVMKMKKTEGTVGVSDSSGKEMSFFKNMNLRNGYVVDTEEKSYAWISLDESKLVKMDALSEAGIRKKGKKLEILLESGNLFFDVSESLEDDETMCIRTSTMAVGIRGTCGWTEVMDQNEIRVNVLEGEVEVSVTNPLTGSVKTGNVSSGQSVLCIVYDEDVAAGGGGEM